MKRQQSLWEPRMAEVISLHRAGATMRQIAEHFGSTLAAASSAWLKYRLKSRHPTYRNNPDYQYIRDLYRKRF